VVSTGFVFAGTMWSVWKLFIVKRWVEDVEYEANVDANEALEELDGNGNEKEDGKGKEEGGKKKK
jgi:hypothetical protein